MEMLTIGQVGNKAGVNIETVRYYERRGLIPKPLRAESGYRQYSDDTVKRIRFVKHAQELGFSLKEISELLSLRVDSKTSCGEIRDRAKGKIDDIESKIKSLQKMKKALGKLVHQCSSKGPVKECPILEALDK